MNWGVLSTTFGLVFLAELGDKTQLAVLAQVCKHRRPWPVFLGASLALAAVTALGAVGGRVLGEVVPAAVLQGVAAVAFVGMGLLVGREAALAGGDASAAEPGCDPAEEERTPCAPPISGWDWRAFGSTFGLLFVAEMGDKTQLAVISLAGKRAESLAVFVGGALALVAVTALGTIGGERLCRLVPRRALLWITAGYFVLMGILIGLGVL